MIHKLAGGTSVIENSKEGRLVIRWFNTHSNEMNKATYVQTTHTAINYLPKRHINTQSKAVFLLGLQGYAKLDQTKMKMLEWSALSIQIGTYAQ